MEVEWVEFRIIKSAVTIRMVLDHYGVVLKKTGHELRGKCPIHRGPNNKHFTANTSKNVFKCFLSECDAHGNAIDFVVAMEHCSVREAAVKLRDWFKVGDTNGQSTDGAQEEAEIKKGIYSDHNGSTYEVIGIAYGEHAESFVVYRELFGEYRLLVISPKGFAEKLYQHLLSP